MAIGDSTLSISGSSTSVPSPAVITSGQRIKVTSGSNTDYYAITNSPTGQLVTGVTMNWVDCDINPTATHTHSAGDRLEFRPYVESKATIPSQTTKVGLGHSVNLTDYFNMVGGKDSDLSFIARPGGSNAQVSVSQNALAIAGNKAGTISVTVTAFDRSQGRVSQTFSVIVTVANRAPESVKAIGNPTIGVGESRRYDLDDYFRDPDGDALSYQTTGIDRAVATVTQPGSELVITGVAKGDVTMLVESTDQFLKISQQIHVTVPANRRPIRKQHIPPVALSIGGLVVLRHISDSFSDPDGGQLRWLAQWEEGDTTHQYRQEFWTVDRTQGSNLLYCNSHFQYPPGSIAPWKSGNAWIMPAGTDITLRTATTVDTATAISYRLTAQSASTARWNGTTRRVEIDLRTSTAIPAGLAPPSRVLLGTDADKAWIEGDMQSPMNFIPGDSYGSRTAYVKVFDLGTPPLFSSDLFQVALGRLPVTTAIDNIAIFTGSTHPLELTDHFSDPDGDKLRFGYTESTQHITKNTLVGSELRIYGFTTGTVNVTVTATDPIGLFADLTFAITVTESAVTQRTPLITPFRAVSLIDRRAEQIEFDYDGQLIKMDAIVLSNAPVLESPNRPEFQVGFPSNYSIVISDLELKARLTPRQRNRIAEFNLNVPTEILANRDLPSITVRGQTRYPIAVYRAIESGHTLYWRINLTSTRVTVRPDGSTIPVIEEHIGWTMVNNVAGALAYAPWKYLTLGGGEGERVVFTVDIHPFIGTSIIPRTNTLDWQRGRVPFTRPNWLLPESIFKRTPISSSNPNLRSVNDQDAGDLGNDPVDDAWRYYWAATGYELQATDGIWHRVNFDVKDNWGLTPVYQSDATNPLLSFGYLRDNRPAYPGKANRRIFRMQHYINEGDWVGKDIDDITVAAAPNIRFIDADGNVLNDPIEYVNRDDRDSDDYLINEDGSRIPGGDRIELIPDTAPGIPRRLRLDVTTDEQIGVTWRAPNSDGGQPITGYNVQYRRGTVGDFTDIAVTGLTTTITGLDIDTYQVKVAAINSIGTGAYSDIESANVTGVATVPNVPTGLTLSGAIGQFTATWIAPANDGGASITGYDVNYRVGNTGSFTSVKVTALTTTITGLAAAPAYQVKVAAINSVGTGAFTPHKFVTVTAAAPGVPTGLTLDVTTATQIVASWTAPANNGGSTITGYYVEYRPGTSGSFANMTVTTTTATITSLAAGAYQVKVAAINAIGTGLSTTPISATVTAALTVPNAPTSLSLTGGSTQFTASWIAPVIDGGTIITGYDLNYRLGVSGNWTSVIVTALTATITGLAAGSYQVRVAAVNAVGTGGHSGTHLATVTALTAPGVPTNYRKEGNLLLWDAPTTGGPVSYYERSQRAKRVTSTIWLAWGVLKRTASPMSPRGSTAPGWHYEWRVRGVNSAGNGPWTTGIQADRTNTT